MHRKNIPGSATSVTPLPSENLSGRPDNTPSPEVAPEFPHIDFKTREFNVIDDLDDNLGNYRHFQELEGITTADMRHQEERLRQKFSGAMTGKSRPAESKTPAGTKGGEDIAADISPVTVFSRGRTLIIDTDLDRGLRCGEFLEKQGLRCILGLVGSNAATPLPLAQSTTLPLVRADAIDVRGSFGGFTAWVASNGGQTKQPGSPGLDASLFDLVLDLQSVPSFTGNRLPLGYYAPGADSSQLEDALRELPEMKGRFTKPRFALLRVRNCLHGRSRSRSCQQCLQACPVGAIRAENTRIFIDPYLCQGCGSCALVCPADAIQMRNPPQKELLARIHAILAEQSGACDAPPVLVLHGGEISSETLQSTAGHAGNRLIFYQVDEIGRVSLEIMLAALAYGAGCIVLACGPEIPQATSKALARQAEIGIAVLRGLEMPADRIRLLLLSSGRHDSIKSVLQDSLTGAQTAPPPTPPAFFSSDQDKRSIIRQAVRHLYEVSAATEPCISLPDGAPFGGLALKQEACTLCMACAGVCPTGALSADGEMPRLYFAEAGCHQCGLCLEVCPEEALQQLPRLDCTAEAGGPEVLREVEPFSCIECGVIFATQSMISGLEEKLAGHWMYSSERQLRRLRMCRSCRTRDALLAKDLQL